VHDSGATNGSAQKKIARRPSTSKALTADEHSLSPPSSRMVPTPSTANDHDIREVDLHYHEEVDLKRPLEYPEINRVSKKMRMDNHPALTGIP